MQSRTGMRIYIPLGDFRVATGGTSGKRMEVLALVKHPTETYVARMAPMQSTGITSNAVVGLRSLQKQNSNAVT
jgi:hypothetical protein